ncbi:MAG: hypothetical protein K2Y32_00605 [Candidatus Obscuribacterales bacterium]|nr:hypothetical protein [Candidatus Obscuribacterales bacterium]
MPRLLILVFFLTVFGLVAFTAFQAPTESGTPAKKAVEFMENIKAGDYKKTVEGFGVNTCRCPGTLGWASYLVYASNEATNIAFMFGKSFDYGEPHCRKIATTVQATTVFDRPEDWDVNVDLRFVDGKFQPLFLPLKMAYGYDMSEAEFNTFLANPDADAWQGFCLRLRPTLAKGVTDFPEEAKALEKKGHDADSRAKAITGGNERAEAIAKNLFGEEATQYLHPKDAGAVIKADGSKMSELEIERQLPRLCAATLRLHMVRRDQKLPFSVSQILVMEPVLTKVSEKGQSYFLKMKNYLPPVLQEAAKAENSNEAK